ncbi:thioredoxin domain protein [Halodesulfurarchaeum formicicum]|uniref:Thioredoxin domain protein n=1 Tax=Halodesulfurarchaeum formicicum TaxID=1873524 RepID=A0A1D8S4J6_9EURY|nr:thioredoxin [Halodesulfurarchaeum formicicum]AOW80273.1 thioredoxin domain protein [Halodesulfurarchaeum formicicum]APE95578.1 thioredoxin domain protein [Halodesulfurarchaeum formicicum]
MSESSDKLESIREQKRAEIKSEMGENTDHTGATGDSPDEPIHIRSPDHFSEVLESHDVVLTDFHAEWCGPCKMLAPIVEELAAETDATMAKVDVDELQSLAQQHRVQGVPTMILFADGEVAERIVGVREKSDIRRLLEREGAA